MTDHLIHTARIEIAYGWMDMRFLGGLQIPFWHGAGSWLFPFEAELRGYDMAAWKEHYSTKTGIYHNDTGGKLK